MSTGVFRSISRAYFSAAKNTFHYTGKAHLLLQPAALIISFIYSPILIITGIVFSAFIILDLFGGLVDDIRRFILRSLERQSWSVDDSFVSLVLRPILVILIAPLFILSLFIPKLSSDALLEYATDELKDIISGAGAFRKLNEILWRTSRRLFIYVSKTNWLLKPIAGIIALFYSPVLIFIGFLFVFFIPLDWVSGLVESSRQGVARFVENRQQNVEHYASAFIFTPPLLVFLAPIFLAILLIPKFASNLENT